MAEERPIVIRFVGEDKVTTVANKVSGSVDKVGKTAGKTSSRLGDMAESLTDVAGAAGMTGGNIGQVAMSLGSLGGPIGVAIGTVVGLGAGLFMLGDSAAKTADRVNNLRRGIISLSDTKEEGEALYQTLIDISARTPFERKDVIEMGRALLNAGVEARDIPDYIYAIGDAVTTIGGSAQTIDSITTAISRMVMQNKLSYEQMQIIQENGIPVFRLLAEATGRTTEEIIKLSQDGLLPAAGNIEIIVDAMQGTYGDAMASQMGTATQATSNFYDEWEDLSTNFGNWIAPVIQGAYDVATATVSATNDAGQALNTLGQQYVDATRDNVQEANDTWGGFKPIFDELGQSASNTWNFMGQEISKVTGYLDEQGKKHLALVQLVDDVGSAYTENNPTVKDFWNTAENGAKGATKATSDFLSDTLFGFQVLLGTVTNNLEGFISDVRRDLSTPTPSFNPFTDTYIGAGQLVTTLPAVADAYAQATQELVVNTEEVKDNGDALRDANEAQRERERILREIENATRDYNQLLDGLRNSYMDIADAERSVADAEKALRDAQDPKRIESMALALQMQQISLRDLNNSMAEMRTRRDEIAKALAGMTDEQIKYNALTEKERNQMKMLNTDLAQLRKRREEVRKALAGNKLTNAQRLEFMQTEAALSAAIGDKTNERQTLEQKQADALKEAEKERLRLLEEDKRLRDELEKAQLRYQQSLIAISKAQQDLAEAQDPNRLDRYRDAVTRAKNNLQDLRDEQIANAIRANELASKLGITSGVMDTLALSAQDTASPLDDVALKSLDLTKAVSGDDGTTENIGLLAENFGDLDDDANSAVSSIDKVTGALQKLDALKLDSKLGVALSSISEGIAKIAQSNEMFSVDNLTAPLTSIRDLTMELGANEASAMMKWSDAYRNAVNASSIRSNVTNLIDALNALRDAVDGKSRNGGGGNGNRSLALPPVPNIPTNRSATATPTLMSAPQNITINLHYASPPNSKTPLQDVENYLAAQGGRLRI